MAEEEKPRPPQCAAAEEAATERRRQRQAAALRANLGRRKSQARERAEMAPAAAPEKSQ